MSQTTAVGLRVEVWKLLTLYIFVPIPNFYSLPTLKYFLYCMKSKAHLQTAAI